MREVTPFFSCVVFEDEYENEQFREELRAKYNNIFVRYYSGEIMVDRALMFGRRIFIPAAEIPNLKKLRENSPVPQPDFSEFLPAGKIPGEFVLTVLNFFREVCAKKGGSLEAHIDVLWSESKGYHLSVPAQTVSQGHVSKKNIVMPTDTIVVVDIHSHNVMGAFFSGTDDGDDRTKILISMVFGKVTSKNPEVTLRMNFSGGKNQKVNVLDVFQELKPDGVIPPVDEAWFDQIDTKTYGGVTYLGYPYGVEYDTEQYGAGKYSGRNKDYFGRGADSGGTHAYYSGKKGKKAKTRGGLTGSGTTKDPYEFKEGDRVTDFPTQPKVNTPSSLVKENEGLPTFSEEEDEVIRSTLEFDRGAEYRDFYKVEDDQEERKKETAITSPSISPGTNLLIEKIVDDASREMENLGFNESAKVICDILDREVLLTQRLVRAYLEDLLVQRDRRKSENKFSSGSYTPTPALDTPKKIMEAFRGLNPHDRRSWLKDVWGDPSLLDDLMVSFSFHPSDFMRYATETAKYNVAYLYVQFSRMLTPSYMSERDNDIIKNLSVRLVGRAGKPLGISVKEWLTGEKEASASVAESRTLTPEELEAQKEQALRAAAVSLGVAPKITSSSIVTSSNTPLLPNMIGIKTN